MSKTQLKLVVLYADVSGSTSLYEKFGDKMASSDVHVLLDLLTEVVEEHDGRKIKTIGDEIMCMFYKPEKAALAAINMNQILREASEAGCGRFEWSVLDWNEPTIAFYRALGAVPLSESTIYRLQGERLAKLAH